MSGTSQIVARCLVIGLGYAVVTLVMGVVLRLGTGDGIVTAFLPLTLGGTLLALVLSPAIHHLPLARLQRVAVLWAMLFLVGYLINALEAAFFTTLPLEQLALHGEQALGTSFIVAWLFDRLFPAQPPIVSLGQRLRDLLGRRSWPGWLGRLLLCGLAYALVYLVVGAVFYLTFTQPFYTDPTLAEQLHLRPPPGFGVILPLELVRGLLFTPALLPLMFSTIVGAESFLGEKERKTIEALIYTPASDGELFLGKVLASVVPAVVLAWASIVVYAVVVNAAGWSVMGRIWFPPVAWWPLMLWVAPAIATLGMAVTVLISARVNTFMEAYQMSAALVVLVLAMVIGQITGVLYLSVEMAFLVGLVFWLVDALLIWFGIRNFGREALLSRL